MGGCVGRNTDIQINAIIPSQRFGQNNALLDKWSEQQVRLLNNKFNECKSSAGLDFSSFEKLLINPSYFPKLALRALFKQFTSPDREFLTFRNFCILVAQVFLSNKREKSELVFKIFNQSNSGVWSEVEKNTFVASYKDFLKTCEKNSDFSYSGGLKVSEFADWAVKNLDLNFLMRPFELIPSPGRERALIDSYLSELVPSAGMSVCLISSVWWETWKNYVSFEKSELGFTLNHSINFGDRPVAIDNSHLLLIKTPAKLKAKLKPDKDFVIVTEKVWKNLHEWYGGGPTIIRKYIQQGSSINLELNPPIFKIILLQSNGNPSVNFTILQFSSNDTFQTVLAQSAKEFKRNPENSRIWVRFRGTFKQATLTEKIENSICYDEEILFESCLNDKGKIHWPREGMKDRLLSIPSNTLTASSSNSEDSKRNTEIKRISYLKPAKSPGVVGLVNLGNTCFFNCILQALVHTPLLQEFFSTSNVVSYLNKKTKTENSIASELSSLCKEIWSGEVQIISPFKLFKEITEKFPMFDDKNQHDCHEFLSMFLDSLHEELRREGEEESKSTVIIENPENRQIEIQESEKQWQLLQGNQGSIITDICAGQTKTTLTCTSCGSTRILFEIFTNLSLPIPYLNHIAVYITIVPAAAPSVKIGLMASKHCKIKEILEEISSFSGINKENILLFDGSYNLNYRAFDNSPELNLGNIGITTKAELFAVQGKKTVKECEEQGKRVNSYKQGFGVNEQVDILFRTGKWVSGKIVETRGEDFLVDYDYLEGKELKTSAEISAFRSQTSYVNPLVYTVFITNVVANNRKRLGYPLALNIGSWYSLEDLYQFAWGLVSRHCPADFKSTIDPFRMIVIDSISMKCGICRNSVICTGCPLKKSKNEVRSLFTNNKKISILAEWNEKYFNENLRHDSSVQSIKDKEKSNLKSIDIETCLNEFTKEERLEMKCEKCPNQFMKMKMEIWKTPDILILSFKRFTYSKGVIEKINSLVNFPFNSFEISQFVKSSESSRQVLSTSAGQNSYDLYGIVLHSGSVSSGHYTSLINLQNNWVLFDDDSILELSESPENSNLLSSSYLLMYRRRRFSSSNVINLTYN